jgi:transcriptional regulator with XRE-family HTH domain
MVIPPEGERYEASAYGISDSVSLNDLDVRRTELRLFLRDRRSRVKPADVGLPAGARRRVPGLRREEVAALAGVGLTWYTMFENGTAPGVSNDLVERVADALRLTAGERMHLHSIATRTALAWPEESADPLLSEALRGWIDAPAYVVTYSWDVVDWNAAYAFVWDIEPPGSVPFNLILRFFSQTRMQAVAGASWPTIARARRNVSIDMGTAFTRRTLRGAIERAPCHSSL